MSRISGFRCNGCTKLNEHDTLPAGWMTITVNVVGNKSDDIHICSNLCLEKIGRMRKQAEKEVSAVG